METFRIKTEIKESLIPGAGRGRFFAEYCKKGTIVRVQIIPSEKIFVFKNVDQLKSVSYENLVHFCHTKPIRSTLSTDYVYLNNPPLYTNHSTNNNIDFHYTDTKKITYTTRDVKAGEEMVQNYCNYTKVDWFENYLHSINAISVREFGERIVLMNSM